MEMQNEFLKSLDKYLIFHFIKIKKFIHRNNSTQNNQSYLFKKI